MRFLGVLITMLVCVHSASALQRKPEIRVLELEQRIHSLINSERRANDLEPLLFDDGLSSVARANSRDMAERGFFDHVNPDGRNPKQRAFLAGYTCRKGLAENIYQNNLYSRVTTTNNRRSYDWKSMEEIAAGSVRGWMHSAGHRRNILEATYGRTGIGAAIAAGGEVYITQMFCG
ncbi:MAG: CAP domain-containing protein [Acidobacteria bacterium]|nr:MAG: CAP domain-containing protein [Acidobacteriota bacterium]